MASYNWKEHLDKDLWNRYDKKLISEQASHSMFQAKELAEKYIGRVKELCREYDREEPDQLELALDLFLNARTDPVKSIYAELFEDKKNKDFQLFKGLVELRNLAYLDKKNTHVGECPRLFISHRQVDYPLALRIAKLAIDEGMQVWLDVIDPTMIWLNTVGRQSFTPRQRQLIIAVVIEMALLHSSHVMAVITQNSKGSGWIGYEYGRVKDSSINSLQTACWLDPALGSTPWEYLLLGVNTNDENSIKNWLEKELDEWERRYPDKSCKNTIGNDWCDEWGDPPTLPGSRF